MGKSKNLRSSELFHLCLYTVLLLQQFCGFGYVSGVMFEMAHSINCTMIEIKISDPFLKEPACSLDNLSSVGHHGANETALVYLIIIIVISGSQSSLDTLIPALAGDQVSVIYLPIQMVMSVI